jgi:hypothetical protein
MEVLATNLQAYLPLFVQILAPGTQFAHVSGVTETVFIVHILPNVRHRSTFPSPPSPNLPLLRFSATCAQKVDQEGAVS